MLKKLFKKLFCKKEKINIDNSIEFHKNWFNRRNKMSNCKSYDW